MRVTLVFHLEPVESGEMVWWVDSPDLPGFYATRQQLNEVRLVAEMSALEMLQESGEDAGKVSFAHVLADDRGSVLGSDAAVRADDSLTKVA